MLVGLELLWLFPFFTPMLLPSSPLPRSSVDSLVSVVMSIFQRKPDRQKRQNRQNRQRWCQRGRWLSLPGGSEAWRSGVQIQLLGTAALRCSKTLRNESNTQWPHLLPMWGITDNPSMKTQSKSIYHRIVNISHPKYPPPSRLHRVSPESNLLFSLTFPFEITAAA